MSAVRYVCTVHVVVVTVTVAAATVVVILIIVVVIIVIARLPLSASYVSLLYTVIGG